MITTLHLLLGLIGIHLSSIHKAEAPDLEGDDQLEVDLKNLAPEKTTELLIFIHRYRGVRTRFRGCRSQVLLKLIPE